MSESTKLAPRTSSRWVRAYWADRMRCGNAPDLPEYISIETFNSISEALAKRVEPKEPSSR